jgi:group I intron endonuclease
MIIYQHTNRFNGNSYIGKTSKTLEQRWRQHVWESFDENKTSYGSHFHRAIRKYGPEAFEHKIIHICESKEEMDYCEIFYISFFDTKNNGYNMTDGGDGQSEGFTHSEEVRQKIGAAGFGTIN